jgi:glycosyltransferase involved in cell wall biosynthesis
MTARPLVSVVIPVHNRAHLLGRAVQSVRAQTFQDLELVVVDDGSTDGSAEVVGPSDDPRIRVVRLTRKSGVSRARNTGILHARGSLVAFLDSDDEWLPDKLERQIAHFQQPEEDNVLVSCRHVRYDDLTDRVAAPSPPIPTGEPFGQIVDGQAPLPSCVVVPRAAITAVGALDETLAAFADYELWLRLADAGTRFVELGDVLVIKHEHGARQISAEPDMMISAFWALDQKWGARIEDRSGRLTYRRWRAEFLASIQYVRIRQAVARGDRRGAWHHWLRMYEHVPWSRRYAIYGFGLAALGLRGYDTMARVKDTVARRLARR